MKRAFAPSLALVVAALLAGCGQTSQESPPTTAQQASTRPNPNIEQPSKPLTPTQVQTKIEQDEQKKRAKALADATGDQLKVLLPPNMVPHPKGTDHYGPSKMTPEQLASAAEAHMAALKSVSAAMISDIAIPGGKGHNVSTVAMRNQDIFRAEYMRVVDGPMPSITKDTLVSDGKTVSVLDSDGEIRNQMSVSDFGKEASQGVTQWTTTFPRIILTGLAGQHPLQSLVASARRAGLNVTAEERWVPTTGRLVHQRRLLISRPDDLASKRGSLTIEVVIDGTQLLPVTIRADEKAPNAAPTMLQWTAHWNLNGGQTFAADAFQAPRGSSRQKSLKT